MKKITRRTFLRTTVYSLAAAGTANAYFVEPEWLVVRKLILNKKPTIRIAHISDVHYNGDASYFSEVIDRINDISPDFTCFTGDLIDQRSFLRPALDILKRIQSPLYGVPGNHDYTSGASFSEIGTCFQTTGGAWLQNQEKIIIPNKLSIVGAATLNADPIRPPETPHRILLCHYPAIVDKLEGRSFDLILAGHSHGGQVRMPFVGAMVLPYGVGPYVKGLYQTSSGPLYVNVGIGVIGFPVRFLCRPEITVIEI